MSDLEFEILDELYFAIRADELSRKINIPKESLKEKIWEMNQKGWVKVMKDFDEEIEPCEDEFEKLFENYHYIASKKGLLLHNSR